MTYLCRQVIDQNRNGNLHIFVNSVDLIGSVIKKAKLQPEQVKVVCAGTGESAIKNARKLGEAYPIQQPSDPVKKINFYTSTAFEGCDIYDKFGRTYIVSDASKSHTLLDISTLFIQICGRIRDSIYKSEITHVFSTTRYSEDLTLEEYTERTQRTLDRAVRLADDINQVPDDSRKWALSKIPYINEKYLRIENGRLAVDKNLANIDIVNFKITKQIYKTVITLSGELKQSGFGVSVKSVRVVESPSEKVEMNPKAKVSFKELFDEYADIKERPISFSFDTPHYKLEIIESANPLVKDAYNKLGRAKVERLKYNQTNIRRELVKRLDISTESKVVEMVNASLSYYKAIPKAEVKSKLQDIYERLEVNRTAKATDLNY